MVPQNLRSLIGAVVACSLLPELVRVVLEYLPFVFEFKHQRDGDENGLLYWLGTRRLTTPWTNPANPVKAGAVAATMSSYRKSLPPVACAAEEENDDAGRRLFIVAFLHVHCSWGRRGLEKFFCTLLVQEKP